MELLTIQTSSKRPNNNPLSHSAPFLLHSIDTTNAFSNLDEDELFDFRSEVADASAISFADELFEKGSIVPLKLPPRLQAPGDKPSSSLSANSVLRNSFSRLSFRNKDFDPFMAALEQIRREEEFIDAARWSPRRRARSLSPLRGPHRSSGDPEVEVELSARRRDDVRKKEMDLCKVSKRRGIKSFMFTGRRPGMLPEGKAAAAAGGGGDCFCFASGSCQRRGREVMEEFSKKTVTPFRHSLLLCFGFNV